VPIYIFVLWVIDPWLGVIAIVFGIVFLGLAYLTHRLTHEPAEQAMESASLANQYAQGKLRNADVIESMGMMKDLRRRWLSRHAQEIHDHSVSQELTYRVYAISKFVRYSQQSLVLGGAALIVIHGDLSPGAMIAANALVIRALQPLDSIIGGWKSFFTARVSFLRLETLLAKFPERAAGLAHRRPTGQLALESLSATAPGRPVPILSDLSADFPAGELIGIVGPSGSGKSTLARCLVGVWPDVAGKVLIDGQTIESWSRSELGPYLGYLPQEVGLLDGTIAENIARFGEVDSAKVIEAAQLAGIHEMILHFPKGYDTPIGESGGQISGGQRQRLGLARAMYGDPAILVLDEPNANLDEAGEVALAKAIVKLKAQGKTVFLITHRKQILVLVDRILLLQDGSIKACGPRRDVLPRLFAHSEKTPMTEVSEDHAAS
jgi:ATP-binding cassette subfamily C exporter for protease/lipase